MGLKRRQRAAALLSPIKRLHALDVFTAVARPITYPELMAEHERERRRKEEAREAAASMAAHHRWSEA